MKMQTLWYVRRGEKVSGPFPGKHISREWLLGRYLPTDEVSSDQVFWSPLDTVPELRPQIGGIKYRVVGPADAPLDWVSERRSAALRWLDERRLRDRRQSEDEAALLHNRRSKDRRKHRENAQWADMRTRHAELEMALKQRRDRFYGVALVLMVLFGILSYAVLEFAPVRPVKIDIASPLVACAQPAAAQVDWKGCDKSGAYLQGANLGSALLMRVRFNAANLSKSLLNYANLSSSDLSFANFNQAKMIGANLQSSNLRFAELRDADLRYADFRNAQIEGATWLGARLDGATWVDGHQCAPLSVGECK